MDKKELLRQAQERRKALYESIKTAATNDELDNIELDIRKADMEIKNLEEQIQAEEGNDPATRSEGTDPEQRGGFNPIATFRSGEQNNGGVTEEEDIFGSIAYRKAFRNYVVSGTPIPQEFVQQRANDVTLVGEVGAIIPTTIMNKVIEDLTVEGEITKRITQTQFQGGVDIPISEILPEAKWVTEETTSEEQKAKMKAKISFGYHILEAKVALGILSATVTLPVFESTIIKQLKKAMVRAIEKAVINGSGSGQPLGITKYSNLPSEQVVELADNEISTVKGWAKVEAGIKAAYETNTLVYLMNKSTWDVHLNGMVDSNGQKIGLGRIDEKGVKKLNGRDVITVDSLIGYDKATQGDIIAVLVDLETYLLNSNMAMYYKKWFDEDTNKYKHKTLMIVDGKLAIGEVEATGGKKMVGAGGLVYVKKK